MINSMTGYATATVNQNGQTLSLDLRTVNSRYLEWHFRAGDEFRLIESAMRERVQQQLMRGKVECRISLSAAVHGLDEVQLNTAVLAQLSSLSQQVLQELATAKPLTVAEVLRWSGVLTSAQTEIDLPVVGMMLLNQALADLQLSRRTEGEKLAVHIVARLDAMQAQIADIQPHLPDIMSAYQLKIKERFDELVSNLEDERIAQEIALFAQKIDVDEELSRLQMHMQAVRDILKKGGMVGKRLDFMMQELNREANTLGSKSVSVETTRAAVELKVLIEQMREQIQNIE